MTPAGDARSAPWRPPLPPWSETAAGTVRRVGVEIEMIGPDVEQLASLVHDALGGELELVSPYEAVVRGDEAGPWRVELDFGYLKRRGRDHDEPPSLVDELAEGVMRAGAEAIVPVELVCPPLPIPALTRVESLLPALRRLGAQGTRAGLAYAFGMHLNPEMPRCDAPTILAYLRAFACLHDWLARECRVDTARRMTRYAAPYPAEYVRRLVDPGYAPDVTTLIDDYLEANPTRNRALDMMPLFAELDEPRVRAAVDDPRIRARPALHYRLPNCEIDAPGWGLHVAWSQWLQVEHLAADPGRLGTVCGRYAAFLDRTLSTWLEDWAEQVEAWLVRIDEP